MANVGSQPNIKFKYFRSKYQLKHDANLPSIGKILYQGSIKPLYNSHYLLSLQEANYEELEKRLSQGYKFILVYVQETCK